MYSRKQHQGYCQNSGHHLTNIRNILMSISSVWFPMPRWLAVSLTLYTHSNDDVL